MSIKFVTAGSTQPVVEYLSQVISAHLADGDHILWLLAGGSAIPVSVAVARSIGSVPPDRLTISLTDERYGAVGHADSNWKQLIDGGFNLPGAIMLPVLTGLDQSQTAVKWGSELDQAFESSDYRLGLFGIGPDGHTSGILPGTPAVEASQSVFSYDGGSYDRITTTVSSIGRLDEAVVYAVGPTKWPVLDQLEHAESAAVQPAQILKQVSQVTIFTDRPDKPE
jgi:6-phosphogluconolactonase/glucosamine-6-phosphate isomerase/deaminase